MKISTDVNDIGLTNQIKNQSSLFKSSLQPWQMQTCKCCPGTK